MKKMKYRWALLAMVVALATSMMTLNSCGDDEPDGEASIVGQWEMSNIKVLKNNNLDKMSAYFTEVDAVVYDFQEDKTLIQYVQKHGKWYIAGKARYTLNPLGPKYGTVNLDCYFNTGIPIPNFNSGVLNYEYYLTTKSLSLNAVIERIEMKFKPTSGITATEYNQ